jgi:serine/threonine protein kinase
MADARHCPECQAELPPDAPDGLCAQCLALHNVPTAEAKIREEARISPSYSGPFTAPQPADLAQHFPHLEILDLLGQGGMGAVYKARQSKLDRLVALKVLPPEAGRDPAFAERFTREARALARLNHPNIVTVYDFGQAGTLWYFLMEYVDGANLRRVFQSSRVQPSEALKIVPQICDALQFAHDEGIVHRDIKPENILLDKRGRVKIADFGIAKILGHSTGVYTLTAPWQVVGTLHYMAPEQIDNPLKVDHRADIYSLGVVFYEMLTGQLPLGRFALPSEKASIDVRLDQVVLRALENEPDRRYQHASEVRTDVEAITAGSPQHAVSTSPRLALTQPRERRGTVLPVKTSAYGGLGEAHGLLRLEGENLLLELEISFLKLARSSVREIKIPLSDIGSVTLDRKMFTSVLILRAQRLRSLSEIPGASEGKVELEVARGDVPLAEQFVAETSRYLGIEPATLAAASGGSAGGVRGRMLKPALSIFLRKGLSVAGQIRTLLFSRPEVPPDTGLQAPQPPRPASTPQPPSRPAVPRTTPLPSVLPATPKPPTEPMLASVPRVTPTPAPAIRPTTTTRIPFVLPAPEPPPLLIARRLVRGPAIGLLVAMVQAIAIAISTGVELLVGSSDEVDFSTSGLKITLAVIQFVFVPLLLLSVVGAIQMLRLKSYRLAKLSCVIACIPCHLFFLITLLMGIWGLRRLREPEVKLAFGRK